ncbi:hypothetical protein PR001_g32248 [Phytophthora rubi]|uniref:PiggyBac transposable element-derived protein domain-containing protein n=2 Tax=Phytophthora rubi TaxID=129364 RepID=A0A6A3G913_9STRA|nr:hypothetical protein PR001_g32248 [Phytophthora rubi]
MAKTNIPETAMPEVPTIEVVNAETPMSALRMGVALDLRMTNPSMPEVDSSGGEGIAERAAMNTEESGLDAFYCDQFIDAMRAEKLFNPVGADDVNLSVQAFQADDEDESVSDAVEDPQTVVDSYDIGVQSDSDIEDESNQFQQDDDVMGEIGASGWNEYDEHHSVKSATYNWMGLVIFTTETTVRRALQRRMPARL